MHNQSTMYSSKRHNLKKFFINSQIRIRPRVRAYAHRGSRVSFFKNRSRASLGCGPYVTV